MNRRDKADRRKQKAKQRAAAQRAWNPSASVPGDRPEETRILRVAAFWREDEPGGITVHKGFDGDEGNVFASACERAMPHFDMHETPGKATAWLGTYAQTFGDPSDSESEDAKRAIATIHWLERRGHIKSDEYNGVLWIAHNGDTMIQLRHDAPSEAMRREYITGPRTSTELLDPDRFEALLRDVLGTPPQN
ncbi:MAG TPA: hypothetical protein VKU41_08335 [Polyangiaceae bacterium]|nr:hypothetical protein [Polyangiaceae bacterium]